ncbi:UDP-glucose--hexose-1-phosphate uridylyltransferase [Tepidibacillus fermentans]|uniref:Galactose-1-phosphate uridylyltransferase n=1 Tax=Tepidibacillus fermentans TaxID=1281767 RepID=A0A4V2URI0_9BACI|nr:UDP-glucose--hexose-1-phosphate uridylyltransferase [Tepidibacillus fermentans]TCS77762.1 UTP-hexose-1-phosphate uridylyltransferase [Tepidibacillus fermentans]
MEIYSAIEALVKQALSIDLIDKEDKIYARNQIMSLLVLNDFPEQVIVNSELSIPDLLDILVEFAVQKNIIEDLPAEREILSAKIMNVFLPRPSDVNKEFYKKYSVNPVEATNYFYKLSKDSNYIQTRNIAKNINYVTGTPYGELDITINLSKPEKDPKQIAREREMKTPASHYPKCLLCIENEGYEGRINHPARSNHRIIPIQLANETWYFQYSPYVYYNEHCIILSAEHRDMKIDRETFERLLEFVEKFPHYFLGSNADLPIVGGSILSHDHYQGGNYEFAMARAKDDYTFSLSDYPSIQAAVIRWPMSVIRLRGKDRHELVDAADMILDKWKTYSDPSANIIAETDGTRHNTITPIARKRNEQYEMDLVLRNNRTSEEYPLGIFHPHEDVHHIKKENIGLIEVMGLAVLPARLASELVEIEKYLLGVSHEVKEYHLPWAKELQKKYGSSITADTVKEILRKEVGLKFLRVLEDAGVFKRDEAGLKAFRRFIKQLK